MTESTAEPVNSGMFGALRRLYTWILSWADSPYGMPALFVLAFVESSFFPIPPDPLLMALCLGLVRRSLLFAAVCTVGSVLGGLFGYALGVYAFDWIGMPIVEFYGAGDKFEALRDRFLSEGSLAVFIAALTPIPYKLVTITAGVARMDVPAFVIASVLGRGARFFLVAGLIAWKGAMMAAFIERHFEKLTVTFGLLIIVGFVVSRYAL